MPRMRLTIAASLFGLLGMSAAGPVAADAPPPVPSLSAEPAPAPPDAPAVPSADCRGHAETACRAMAGCYWEEIYGTVPGGAAAAFCRPLMHPSSQAGGQRSDNK